MINIKTIIGVTTVILTFAGYTPYVRDTLKGKTIPHVYTWFIWGFVTAIAYGIQVIGGAGVGSWVTLAVVVCCLFICLLGLKYGKKIITFADTIFFILALLALFLWLIVKQP